MNNQAADENGKLKRVFQSPDECYYPSESEMRAGHMVISRVLSKPVDKRANSLVRTAFKQSAGQSATANASLASSGIVQSQNAPAPKTAPAQDKLSKSFMNFLESLIPPFLNQR